MNRERPDGPDFGSRVLKPGLWRWILPMLSVYIHIFLKFSTSKSVQLAVYILSNTLTMMAITGEKHSTNRSRMGDSEEKVKIYTLRLVCFEFMLARHRRVIVKGHVYYSQTYN